VAVDIRQGSPTFLHWHAELLSAENHKSYFLPEGFAHGCQALTDNCELIYLHSESFRPETIGTLNVSDPKIAIKWRLEIRELSERDRQRPFIGNDFKGVAIP
jgi:dTDP-4-dehydrorhamnose 3,5-epimerase